MKLNICHLSFKCNVGRRLHDSSRTFDCLPSELLIKRIFILGNGSVYTWGSGVEGQLGHGDKVRFLEYPKRIKDRHVAGKVIQIGCGETYSAAITGNIFQLQSNVAYCIFCRAFLR